MKKQLKREEKGDTVLQGRDGSITHTIHILPLNYYPATLLVGLPSQLLADLM